jgi:tetratricopeptide (TPR) repeat protein
VLNNLGSVREFDFGDVGDARTLYEQAVDIGERLLAADPGNREYSLELAKYYNNLAALLHEQGQGALAAERSGRAVELMNTLARLAPSLAIERADTRNLRGVILQAQDAAAAEREFREALDHFAELDYDDVLLGQPDFHVRFGDFLLNLTDFRAQSGAAAGARLLSDAVDLYAGVAARVAESGSTADFQNALETLSRVLPALRESEQVSLQPALEQLQLRLGDGPAAP